MAARTYTDLRTHLAEVVRTAQLTPGVRRITFAGDDLTTFRPIAPDQFLNVLLPPPGRDELTIGRDFDWASWRDMGDDVRPVHAPYTVRHFRPDAGEIDIDFVQHHPQGPACIWSAAAAPGAPVALWGPRTTYDPPDDVDAFLLIVDDTGVPAAAVIVEHLAAIGFTGPVRVLAEVADAAERRPLALGPAGEVAWLSRDGAPAGLSTLLLDTVLAGGIPGERTYVWGGGESRAMTSIRKHVRRVVGLPRTHVSLTAYWRHALHAADPEDREQ